MPLHVRPLRATDLLLRESSGRRSSTKDAAATPRGSQSPLTSGPESEPHSRRGSIPPTSAPTASRNGGLQICAAEWGARWPPHGTIQREGRSALILPLLQLGQFVDSCSVC